MLELNLTFLGENGINALGEVVSWLGRRKQFIDFIYGYDHVSTFN